MAYKQQKFIIFHCSGDWKAKIRFGFWRGPPSGCRMPACLLKGRRAEHTCSLLASIWALILFSRVPPQNLINFNYLPKTPPPNTITLGTRVSPYAFWGRHGHSVHNSNISHTHKVYFTSFRVRVHIVNANRHTVYDMGACPVFYPYILENFTVFACH